jgi:hypothetical protein
MSVFSLRFFGARVVAGLVGALLLTTSCGDDLDPRGGAGGAGDETPAFTAPDRADDDRTPLEGVCDDVDAARCLLPWPNDAFTRVDPATETGLRLAVPLERINPEDDASLLARADGFSRVTSLVASFTERLDEATAAGSVRLFLAEPGHPGRGAEVPLWTEIVAHHPELELETAIVAHPRVPLEANARYVAIVTDALRAEGGAPLSPSRFTELALGRVDPASQPEADVRGHHAPTRRLLAEVGVDPATVLRAWDFTTRSAEDPRQRLRAMREAAIAAVEDGEVEVVVETVEAPVDGPIAAIVRGHLAGLPDFLADDGLRIDASGAARAEGTREARFRVVVPRGEGDYRTLLYGHGTGGSVDEASFDADVAAAGAAKVSLELVGWTSDDVVQTFLRMQDVAYGSSVAAASLVQSVADGAAIERALDGPLGDVLAGEQLAGAPNPVAGRRPDTSIPIWIGGSLGGTVGLLFTAATPELDHAVLNVPGAAWASWVRHAEPFRYIQAFAEARNGGPQNLPLAIAIAQTMLDEADGAVWVDVLREEDPMIALAQESIGDPVLPNPGTEMVAQVLGASIVGEPLVPIDGLERSDVARGASGLTQFWVEGGAFDVHGFAAGDTAAAEAAKEQIFRFVDSVWAGSPTIEVPAGCPAARCDFR